MENVRIVQALNTRHMVAIRNVTNELFFFNKILDVITKAVDPEDLEEGMRLLFALKIKEKYRNIPFDYGLTKEGMVITHSYTEGPIMYVLFETDLEE